MSLFWGVTPLPIPKVDEADLRVFVLEWCKTQGLIGPGDVIVGIRGAMPANPDHNEIVVHEVH